MDKILQPDEGQRKRPRVNFDSEVIITYDGKETEYKHTHDVSMNGVFVSTANPLPMGAKGPFSLILAVGMRRETVKGNYEVVRVVTMDEGLSDTVRGGGMGLKFLELDPISSELLFRVIEYNQPPE